MAWITENWGTTLGTAGAAGWTRYVGPLPWGTLGSIESSNYGVAVQPTVLANRNRAALSLTVDGALTGQWQLSGTLTDAGGGDSSWTWARLSSYSGTDLYVTWGALGTNSLIRFRSVSGTGSAVLGTGTGRLTGGNVQFLFSVAHTNLGSYTATMIDPSGTISYTYPAGTNYVPAGSVALWGQYSTSCRGWIGTTQVEYTPTDSILRFIGTWATGSGTYQWGQDIIGAPSNIQDRAFGPLDSAGWASTVSVTLDDSTGQWGAFAGTGQTPYEGTWQFRRQWNAGEISGTWVTLLTGFVEPESVQYDYARRTARLTVQSSIARASQQIALHNWAGGSGELITRPCYQYLLGTITYADSDTGTVRIGNVPSGFWQAEKSSRLWGTSGTETESITIGSSITDIGVFAIGGTGTLVVDGEFPDWLSVNNEIWLTHPWPSYRDRIVARDLSWPYVLSLVNTLGLTWPSDNRSIFRKQAASSPIAPNFRLFGGEKLATALTGIMQACNGFFSVSPVGEFRAFCSIPKYSTAGSADFLTAYDSDWSMGYEASVTGIELDSSFNPETGSYTTHTSVGGTTAWGAVRELKLPWVGSGIEAESLAGRLYRDSYIPRPSLTLRMPGSRWDGYEPGYIYNVDNLPTHLVSKMAGTQFVLYSKTHDWQDDLTALELVAQPGGNYAVWDGTPADTWHESGKVWY